MNPFVSAGNPLPYRVAMRMLCVGGSPSTGSTFLADLLDSVPGIVCPPELYLYCFAEAFTFDVAFLETVASGGRFKLRAPYIAPRHFVTLKLLEQSGIQRENFANLFRSGGNLFTLVEAVATGHAELRGRDLKAFAEKTPANVNCLRDFADLLPDGLGIHTVRNGWHVVDSLCRRGYSPIHAAAIWAIQTDAGLRASRACQNILTLRFEALVSDPFGEAVAIAKRIGIDTDETEVRARYEANGFRQSILRLETWRVKRYGIAEPSTDPSPNELTELERVLINQLEIRATPSSEPIQFSELQRALGYPIDEEASRHTQAELESRLQELCTPTGRRPGVELERRGVSFGLARLS